MATAVWGLPDGRSQGHRPRNAVLVVHRDAVTPWRGAPHHGRPMRNWPPASGAPGALGRRLGGVLEVLDGILQSRSAKRATFPARRPLHSISGASGSCRESSWREHAAFVGHNWAAAVDAQPRLGITDRLETDTTIPRHFRAKPRRAAGPKPPIPRLLHGRWTKFTWCLGHLLHLHLCVPDMAAVGRRTKRRREPLLGLIGLERLDLILLILCGRRRERIATDMSFVVLWHAAEMGLRTGAGAWGMDIL